MNYLNQISYMIEESADFYRLQTKFGARQCFYTYLAIELGVL